MSDEPALLAAIRENPDDPVRRLVYADWLEERGDPGHELIRVCEAMRRVPVYSDEYWRLKARRNELRPACPADWLAATGYDGSRYDPIFRDGVPDGWRERWRLIREFTERWHGVPMADIGGRAAEIAATEERLGLALPPSVREFAAYAHDVSADSDYLRLNRDPVTMEPILGHDAVSISVISEGEWHWGIRLADFMHPDPPVYNYAWRDDATPDEVREQGQNADTVSRFVLNDARAYKPTAGVFRAIVADGERLRAQLETAFSVRCEQASDAGAYESDRGLLAAYCPHRHRRGVTLEVSVWRGATWEAVPAFLWEYAREANTRGGMFFSEEDIASFRRGSTDSAYPDAVPPMRGTPLPRGRVRPKPPAIQTEGNEDIPF